MPALRLARSSRFARWLAKILLYGLGLTIIGMLFLPWQQSLWGTGEVIAYSPNEREQIMESPIKGRIVRLGDGIMENARVLKGQLIAEIQDLDPELLSRLQAQADASQRALEASRTQLEANKRNLEAAHTIVTAYEAQARAYELVLQQVVGAAQAYVEMSQQKIIAEERSYDEVRAGMIQAEQDLERQKTLFQEKLASQLKYQEAERKTQEARAKVQKASKGPARTCRGKSGTATRKSRRPRPTSSTPMRCCGRPGATSPSRRATSPRPSRRFRRLRKTWSTPSPSWPGSGTRRSPRHSMGFSCRSIPTREARF
jgi:multidrug resistance efflux pump